MRYELRSRVGVAEVARLLAALALALMATVVARTAASLLWSYNDLMFTPEQRYVRSGLALTLLVLVVYATLVVAPTLRRTRIAADADRLTLVDHGETRDLSWSEITKVELTWRGVARPALRIFPRTEPWLQIKAGERRYDLPLANLPVEPTEIIATLTQYQRASA